MAEPETNPVIQLPLQPSQAAVVTRDGWRVEFNEAGAAPQISHNGQAYDLTPAGVAVPCERPKKALTLTGAISEMIQSVMEPAPIDGAPAVLWHRTNGRLTKNDIAKTICDDKDNPIGIYTGVWTPDWANGQEIRTYAAITDARDGDGDRLYQNFNRYVAHLNNHPNGEKLSDRPFHACDVTYEMAMQAKIMGMKPGERTGQMIPTYELLRGQKYPGQAVTHRNNMYDLRHTGDFAKADNGGNDSRFVTETGSGGARWYVSSTEVRVNRADVYGTDFTDGGAGCGHSDDGGWSLRPFVAELPRL